MNTKPWWKSKTIWFNALSVAILVAGGKAGIAVPPAIAGPVLGVGNILLRLVTNQAVAATDQP